MGAVVPGLFLPPLSALPYIFIPVFLGVLLLVWLLLHFLYSFGPLCHPGCLGILYMWHCFSIYTSPLSTAHASSLLITPWSDLVATLRFLLVIYIVRWWSVKSDMYSPFSSFPSFSTRKRVMLSTFLF